MRSAMRSTSWPITGPWRTALAFMCKEESWATPPYPLKLRPHKRRAIPTVAAPPPTPLGERNWWCELQEAGQPTPCRCCCQLEVGLETSIRLTGGWQAHGVLEYPARITRTAGGVYTLHTSSQQSPYQPPTGIFLALLHFHYVLPATRRGYWPISATLTHEQRTNLEKCGCGYCKRSRGFQAISSRLPLLPCLIPPAPVSSAEATDRAYAVWQQQLYQFWTDLPVWQAQHGAQVAAL